MWDNGSSIFWRAASTPWACRRSGSASGTLQQTIAGVGTVNATRRISAIEMNRIFGLGGIPHPV